MKIAELFLSYTEITILISNWNLLKYCYILIGDNLIQIVYPSQTFASIRWFEFFNNDYLKKYW